MSDERRAGKPYFWVTHLTGLVSGEKSCLWAAWYKGRHRYARRADPNEDSLVRWKVEHAEMVRVEAQRLLDAGWAVALEDQNKFTYRGRAATVGGKPDIVATKDDPLLGPSALVVDCKSGKARDSDVVQVAAYLLLAPRDLESLQGRELSGSVAYRDRAREVTAAQAAGLQPRIVRLVEVVAADVAPPAAPSAAECRYCDIAACPHRVEFAEASGGEDAVVEALF